MAIYLFIYINYYILDLFSCYICFVKNFSISRAVLFYLLSRKIIIRIDMLRDFPFQRSSYAIYGTSQSSVLKSIMI